MNYFSMLGWLSYPNYQRYYFVLKCKKSNHQKGNDAWKTYHFFIKRESLPESTFWGVSSSAFALVGLLILDVSVWVSFRSKIKKYNYILSWKEVLWNFSRIFFQSLENERFQEIQKSLQNILRESVKRIS